MSRKQEKTIYIKKEESDYISELLSLTGSEIEKKYNLKPGDKITYPVYFDDDVRMDINISIREGFNSPETEAILFCNEVPVIGTGNGYLLIGEWELFYSGVYYSAVIEVDEPIVVAKGTDTEIPYEIKQGEVRVSAERYSEIKRLLKMSQEDISKFLGTALERTIANSVCFDNDYRMLIELVVNPENGAFAKAVLYDNEYNIVASTEEPVYQYKGTWSLFYNNVIYMVTVSHAPDNNDVVIRIPMVGGALVTKRCKDVDYDGIEIYFETVDGEIIDVVGVNALPNTKEIEVFTFSDIYTDNYTNNFTLDTEEMVSVTR